MTFDVALASRHVEFQGSVPIPIPPLGRTDISEREQVKMRFFTCLAALVFSRNVRNRRTLASFLLIPQDR